MLRCFPLITVVVLTGLSPLFAQETPLHELAPAQRLALVMQLMDNSVGASVLGEYCKKARTKEELEAARGVARFVAGWASPDRSKAQRRRITAFCLGALENQDEQLRITALECLRRSARRGELDEVLVALFNDETPRIRKAALEAAVGVAGEDLIQPLSAVMNGKGRSERERLAALHALAGLPSEETARLLTEVISSEDVRIAANAVSALARMPVQKAIDGLFTAAYSGRPEVRLAAYRGLANFRNVRGFPSGRVAKLSEKAEEERGAAKVYLLRLLCSCGLEEGIHRTASLLRARSLEPGDAALLVEGLGLSGMPEVFDHIRGTFERFVQEGRVRTECYVAAGRTGSAAAVEWLLERARAEDALSETLPSVYEGLTLAASVPADELLPLLSDRMKNVPSHMFLLAASRGPLSRAEDSFRSISRTLGGGNVRMETAAVIFARRNMEGAEELLKGYPQLQRILETPHKDLKGTNDVAWYYALFGTGAPGLIARLMHERVETGLQLPVLDKSILWNRAAASAVLGAWGDLPADLRQSCLASLDLRLGLGGPWRINDLPSEEAAEHLAFLTGLAPYAYNPPVSEEEEGKTESRGGLAVVGGRLRWLRPDGSHKTPVFVISGDIPRKKELAHRLMEAGALVIEEAFMPVDVVLVSEKDTPPPCEAASIMEVEKAAALVGLGEDVE